ncbi:DUF695 domain-containing protein [Marilutibacter maris]|uniref:DUF695 domain-containing protein n=1 Tax=Marilutibacter maris TaxID=1605891 RepID=A0A2U9TDA5_9GAMM|nr:DUF695 domain-containing protein [Lysobacter maris]AWV06220.1 protein of unknown function DUF1260 [Lysobacter maris]
MSDNWDFYFCHVDDHPASIFVDIGIGDAPPRDEYPLRQHLRLRLRAPRDDGLSSEDEFETLATIEDRLNEACARHDLLYVGRCTSDGRRDFIFYARSGHESTDWLAETMAAEPGYGYETGVEADPGWGAYFEFLYPDEEGFNFISNRQVLDALTRNGDALAQPRQIDHWAYFPQPEQRAGFIERMTALGFQVRELLEPDADRSDYGVKLWREDIPGHDRIEAITLPLLRAARECGGGYDGWECRVVTSGRPR